MHFDTFDIVPEENLVRSLALAFWCFVVLLAPGILPQFECGNLANSVGQIDCQILQTQRASQIAYRKSNLELKNLLSLLLSLTMKVSL